MKLIPEGATAHFEVVVTDLMTVDFQQADARLGRLHPVYATYWLARHMELVSRKIILPYLEPGEEGIGCELSVRHLASALPGMTLHFSATCERHDGRRIYARCRAVSELGDTIGEGSTTQVIARRDKLEAGFEQL
ncbi:MAG TPA: thioesterase family protein, partial [Trueperaceae bacterium]